MRSSGGAQLGRGPLKSHQRGFLRRSKILCKRRSNGERSNWENRRRSRGEIARQNSWTKKVEPLWKLGLKVPASHQEELFQIEDQLPVQSSGSTEKLTKTTSYNFPRVASENPVEEPKQCKILSLCAIITRRSSISITLLINNLTLLIQLTKADTEQTLWRVGAKLLGPGSNPKRGSIDHPYLRDQGSWAPKTILWAVGERKRFLRSCMMSNIFWSRDKLRNRESRTKCLWKARSAMTGLCKRLLHRFSKISKRSFTTSWGLGPSSTSSTWWRT